MSTRQKLLPLAFLAAVACGGPVEQQAKSSETLCPAGIAQIGVGDGYFQTLCGCDEPSGIFFMGATPLTCTVPQGTSVVFQFIGSHGVHQIRSVGAPEFPSSPISDPGVSELPVRAHAIRPQALGTYVFQDIVNPTISGRVVIR